MDAGAGLRRHRHARPRVSDGHGVQVDVGVDLYVYAGAARTAALPASGVLGEGRWKPLSPADQARDALGTRDVVAVRRLGAAQVFARRAAVRRGLAARAGSTALAVTCPCAAASTAGSKGGGRTARLARTTARPGRAATLRLSRRAAGLLPHRRRRNRAGRTHARRPDRPRQRAAERP